MPNSVQEQPMMTTKDDDEEADGEERDGGWDSLGLANNFYKISPRTKLYALSSLSPV